jgi:hypothetical protein
LLTPVHHVLFQSRAGFAAIATTAHGLVHTCVAMTSPSGSPGTLATRPGRQGGAFALNSRLGAATFFFGRGGGEGGKNNPRTASCRCHCHSYPAPGLSGEKQSSSFPTGRLIARPGALAWCLPVSVHLQNNNRMVSGHVVVDLKGEPWWRMRAQLWWEILTKYPSTPHVILRESHTKRW